MTCRTPFTVLILAAAVALSAGPAAAQRSLGTPGAVGDYSFFWTTTANNTPVTALTVNPGQTVTVRLWIRETGGGTLFGSSAFGIASYDTRTTWTGGTNLQIPVGAGGDDAENTNVRTNPYASGGFSGAGQFLNSQTAAVNASQAVNLSRAVQNINSTGSYVNNATGPNSTGQLLVNEFTFLVAAGAVDPVTVTAGQRTTLTNWQYGFENNTDFYFDDRIGTTTAQLVLTPVPEPATVLLAGAAGLGAVAGVRRGRRRPAAV